MLLSDGEWSMFKQARLIYQPSVQPTNRPPFPHAPNMPKPQPPIHSFPRNSGTHKQVSPSYSPLPMVAKFQLVHRICFYCERWLGKQFSAHGAWSLSFQICHLQRWIDMRKQKPELEGRFFVNHRFIICFATQFTFCAFLPHILWLSSQECFPRASSAPSTSPQVTNNSILGFAASFPPLQWTVEKEQKMKVKVILCWSVGHHVRSV